MKSLIRYWGTRLERTSQSLEDYRSIAKNNVLTNDMRLLCVSKIESLSKAEQMMIKTIETLKGVEIDE